MSDRISGYNSSRRLLAAAKMLLAHVEASMTDRPDWLVNCRNDIEAAAKARIGNELFGSEMPIGSEAYMTGYGDSPIIIRRTAESLWIQIEGEPDPEGKMRTFTQINNSLVEAVEQRDREEFHIKEKYESQ